MTLYCDTNLILRLYLDLPESAEVLSGRERQRARGKARIQITWLHQLELANACEQLVFLSRHGQGGRMTPEAAAMAVAQFDEELAERRVLVPVALAPGELVKRARALSQRHTARHGFRAYDVAHVASALLLGCTMFWSFDAKACRLAALEGLKVL